MENGFYNSFASFGIVPEKYGHRTVLEYRARLINFSLEGADILSSYATQENLSNPEADVSENNQRYPQLPKPSNADIESVLRVLGATLDANGMSQINPRYLVVLKASRLPSPASDKLGLSRRGNAAPSHSTVPQRDEPSSGLLSRLKQFAESYACPFPYEAPHRKVLSWHWGDERIAVATRQDAVCIYNARGADWDHPPMVSPQMKEIRCISFRPYGGNSVAAACKLGIALWNKNEMNLLRCRGHESVSLIDWSPDGAKLVSSSSNDRSVRLWDVGTRQSQNIGPGGVALFCPKQGSDLLFVASATTAMFRIWNIDTWSADRWGSLSGPVRAATWSPDGSYLLVSAENETAIHVLRVNQENGHILTETVHTEVTSLPQEGPGGCAQYMAFDQHGERLAVVYEVPMNEFSESSFGAEETYALDEHRRYAVALYASQLHPNFSMSPIGFVSGPPQSGPPSSISFRPRMEARTGAVLAVAWASGAITFTQLMFKPAHTSSWDDSS